MGDWLFSWFFKLLYMLQKSICYLLDFIKSAFNKIVGLDGVEIEGGTQDLLSYLMQSRTVKIAFLGILLIGVILVVVFTVLAIIRSEASELGTKKAKGHILSLSGKSLLIFLVIPFVAFSAILLTNVVMQSINAAMSGSVGSGGNVSVGGQILVTSGYDAYKGPSGQRTQIEEMFITGQLDYNNLNVVKRYYDLSDINYFVGIFGSLIILIMFSISALTLIQRLFDILFLFLISPVVVSSMTLDEGDKFRRWTQLSISKLLCAFGVVLSMNLFFMIIPVINRVNFFNSGFQNGIVKLLFVIAGAFATCKANFIVANILGDVSSVEAGQQMLASMRTGGHFIRSAGRAAATGAGFLFGGTDYLRNKKRGAGMSENVKATMHSVRNKHFIEGNKPQSKLQKAASVTRAATLPVGVVKDLVQGGAVTAAKNIKHRAENVIHGTTATTRADYKETPVKSKKIESKGEEDAKNNAEKHTS